MLVNVIDPTLQGQLITIDAVRTVSKYTKIAVIVDKKGHTYCARFQDNCGVEFDAGDEKRKPSLFGNSSRKHSNAIPIRITYSTGEVEEFPSIARAVKELNGCYEATITHEIINSHLGGGPVKELDWAKIERK
jgi:hypothetical protein